MKESDLNILLQEGEGVMLEYKENLSASLAREMVAFANTIGGRILLGVRDNGTIKGIPDTNELRTGIWRICEGASSQGYPEPKFTSGSFFTALFLPVALLDEQVIPKTGTKLALSRHQVVILEKCSKERALLELMRAVARSDRTKFRDQVLNPLLKSGLLEMTIPEKSRSPKQRYRTTLKGRSFLERTDQI